VAGAGEILPRARLGLDAETTTFCAVHVGNQRLFLGRRSTETVHELRRLHAVGVLARFERARHGFVHGLGHFPPPNTKLMVRIFQPEILVAPLEACRARRIVFRYKCAKCAKSNGWSLHKSSCWSLRIWSLRSECIVSRIKLEILVVVVVITITVWRIRLVFWRIRLVFWRIRLVF
jgi:hypothetical protein